MKILHIIGGSPQNGAYKGAEILNQTLNKMGVESSILNDVSNDSSLRKNFIRKILNKIFKFIEKVIKTIFLPSPRSTFTIGMLGFDITKFEEYKIADIIHIHWFNDGFISLSSLKKLNKPTIWTMRDMWIFTGGSHYDSDFEKYEKSFISKKIKSFKKDCLNKKIEFIAISDWLKEKAKKSSVLYDRNIKTIYNNIDFLNLDIISKSEAKSKINLDTQKKILLFGANNPQIKRKGWEIFLESLKKIDKSKYFLSIFGNFWSNKILDEIGIEYKSFGFVNDNKTLNYLYSSSDLFIASSIQEAFGKTWAESLACGTPIICFANTAASEIIKHKKDGYIVDEINSDQLKNGIEWLSQNLEKISDKKDLRKTVEIFNPLSISKQYIKLYKNLTS